MHLWLVIKFKKDLFFHCSHGEEQIVSHDIIWDIFTFIAKNMVFHVNKFMSFHGFPFSFLANGSWYYFIDWWHSYFGQCWSHRSKIGFIGRFISQGECDDANERFYHNWHLMNAFFLSAIKFFGCLHQQVDDFFHQYANMKSLIILYNNFPLIILHVFYRQKVLIILWKV